MVKKLKDSYLKVLKILQKYQDSQRIILKTIQNYLLKGGGRENGN